MENNVIIVSGLPRSGTSMMMRMLEAGGLVVVTDNVRLPDKDNPNGYYEYEKVKKMKDDATWLGIAKGKVIKIVSMSLPYLPPNYNYKIILMQRHTKEILASQRRMLDRLERTDNNLSDSELEKLYYKHIKQTEQWLTKQKNIDFIMISYNELLEKPYGLSEVVNKFLCQRLDIEKMAQVVDVSLYRQR
jgi:hypothetical protein